MKKKLVAVAAVICSLCLGACGGSEADVNHKPGSSNAVSISSVKNDDIKDTKDDIDAAGSKDEIADTVTDNIGVGDKWYQVVTDEELANAKYLWDSGYEEVENAACVLLYEDKERNFALYTCDLDCFANVLIVSNGHKNVYDVSACWDWNDVRNVAQAVDLDNDGFEEIALYEVAGHGTGFYQEAIFVFDSSDNRTFDQAYAYYPEEAIEVCRNDVSVTVNADATFTIAASNGEAFEGHYKGVAERCRDFTLDKIDWGDIASAEIRGGKLLFKSDLRFFGDDMVMGDYAAEGDTSNDVCYVVYEITYKGNGNADVTNLFFEKK